MKKIIFAVVAIAIISLSAPSEALSGPGDCVYITAPPLPDGTPGKVYECCDNSGVTTCTALSD